jgi:hypothetical protein
MLGSFEEETNEAIFVVNAGELNELINVLLHGSATELRADPAPEMVETRPLRCLKIVGRGGSPAIIRIDGDVASIAGSPASLARLAGEIALFREHNDLNEPGMHAHFDPNSSFKNPILAEESVSLRLAGPVP